MEKKPVSTKSLIAVIALSAAGLCLNNLGAEQTSNNEGGPVATLKAPPPLPEHIRNSVPKFLPPDLPDPQDLINQLKQLDELLALPPEKLAKLKETVERIEKMSPEERAAMRIKLSKVTRMTPTLKTEIRSLCRELKITDRSSFSQFWLSLDETKREEIRSNLVGLQNSNKRDILLGMLQRFIAKRDKIFEEANSEK